MRTVKMTIDGEEYVALPRADFDRLVGSAPEETVDAMAFTLAALGRNLKAAREHAGVTQAELAAKLKKSQATVSGSESGKIRVSAKYVAKVLKLCGLPPNWKAPAKRESVIAIDVDEPGLTRLIADAAKGMRAHQDAPKPRVREGTPGPVKHVR